MTAVDERRGPEQLAEQAGWRRNDLDRIDLYLRGDRPDPGDLAGPATHQWCDPDHDDMLMTYTRELPTVSGWLKR